METSISQGLTISILGLIITFTALGVFILIMLALQKVFPWKPEAEEGEEGDEGDEEMPSAKSEEGGEEAETVAAIAAAIAFLRASTQGSVGSNLEAGRGSWWLVNRMAARQSSNLLKK